MNQLSLKKLLLAIILIAVMGMLHSCDRVFSGEMQVYSISKTEMGCIYTVRAENEYHYETGADTTYSYLAFRQPCGTFEVGDKLELREKE